MSQAWAELVAEAGSYAAEMIARAAMKQVRSLKGRPGATGQAGIEIHVARGQVQNVVRVEKHSEREETAIESD